MSVNQICLPFVEKKCYLRDSSHGTSHMLQVQQNALKIYEGENINDDHIKTLCEVVAILHDVADHKYDNNNTLSQQVKEFLQTNFPTDAILIWNIIERISYSKEVKSKADWSNVLGPIGILVRNIVSDADKLEAIGKTGLQRCINFTKLQYLHKNGKEILPEELNSEVYKHAVEKLLVLKDKFIYTATGKKMAKPLHSELVIALTEM